MWHLCDPAGGAGSWAEIVKESSLHVILNEKGEGLVLASGTRLTLLPRTTTLFATFDKAGLMSATRFSFAGGHDFLVLVIPIASVEKIFGPVGPLMKKSLGILRRWSDRETGMSTDLVCPPVSVGAERA
jgi:hypothetical protein